MGFAPFTVWVVVMHILWPDGTEEAFQVGLPNSQEECEHFSGHAVEAFEKMGAKVEAQPCQPVELFYEDGSV